MVRKVTVVTAGHGGITAAFDLRDRGFDVVLYDLPEKAHKLETLKRHEKISLRYKGEVKEIDGVRYSTDINEAIEGSDLIMVVIPGILIEKYARVLAPVVSEGQLIYFNGAAGMLGIRFLNEAKKMGVEHDFFIAESNSLTYATRVNLEEGIINLSLRVKETLVAALPTRKTNLACSMIAEIYDGIRPVENVLRIALENANPEVHPGTCLLNTGWIESKDFNFSLYRDGYTEHSVNLLKAIGKERRAIASELGYTLDDVVKSRIDRGYFADEEKDLHLMFNESPVFSKIDGPNNIKSRYLVEDIADGLVFWSDLGRLVKVETPIIDSIINLGCVVLGMDFWETGMSLERLGLGGLSKEEILNLL